MHKNAEEGRKQREKESAEWSRNMRQIARNIENREQNKCWYYLKSRSYFSFGESECSISVQEADIEHLYLLDEPEVSLSPANQVSLADEINKIARLLQCQFDFFKKHEKDFE